MSEEARPTAARLGIVALNLLAPGLGLLRLGRFGPALLHFAPPLAAVLSLTLFYATNDELRFSAFAIAMALVMFLIMVPMVASMLLSWRCSANRVDRPWWTRWYMILSAWLVCLLLASLAEPRKYYRTFYLPSESMEPILSRKDRFVAAMRRPNRIARGDLVLVDRGETVYLKRVVGLAGDRVAVRGGRLLLNGRPVEGAVVGTKRYVGLDGPVAGRRLRERLPGESATHEILDLGPSEFDEFEEQEVRDDHLFVLGDNRDRSADSRVPRSMMGLEQVPRSDVAGNARFIFWSSERAKIGRSLAAR